MYYVVFTLLYYLNRRIIRLTNYFIFKMYVLLHTVLCRDAESQYLTQFNNFFFQNLIFYKLYYQFIYYTCISIITLEVANAVGMLISSQIFI